MNFDLFKDYTGNKLGKDALLANLNKLLSITNCQNDIFNITKSYDSVQILLVVELILIVDESGNTTSSCWGVRFQSWL